MVKKYKIKYVQIINEEGDEIREQLVIETRDINRTLDAIKGSKQITFTEIKQFK